LLHIKQYRFLLRRGNTTNTKGREPAGWVTPTNAPPNARARRRIKRFIATLHSTLQPTNPPDDLTLIDAVGLSALSVPKAVISKHCPYGGHYERKAIYLPIARTAQGKSRQGQTNQQYGEKRRQYKDYCGHQVGIDKPIQPVWSYVHSWRIRFNEYVN
jgi:hypothetical protein